MTLTHTLLFYLHVTAGSLALPLFWLPVIARKGSFNHRRFGRWFARLMYTVAGSGLLMAGMDLANPLVLHAPGLEAGTAAASQAAVEIGAGRCSCCRSACWCWPRPATAGW